MDLSLGASLFLFILGIVCGVINVLAGGGSNLTLPVLMMYGLPADIANATNRVGIMLQNITGVSAFRKRGRLPLQDWRGILFPVSVGGLFGAISASYAPVTLLKPLLLGTMLTLSAVILFLPQWVMALNELPRRVQDTPHAGLLLFVAGWYGGFVQAGVGFLLLTVLAGRLRYDLVAANALKLFCTLFFTAIALVIFIYNGQVWWSWGLVLAAGNMLGSVLGVRLAIQLKPQTMRFILFFMTLVAVLSAWFK